MYWIGVGILLLVGLAIGYCALMLAIYGLAWFLEKLGLQ